jgi:hypothetical protein
LLLGFDADPVLRNVVGLIEAHPDWALKDGRLRAFGQGKRKKGKRLSLSLFRVFC